MPLQPPSSAVALSALTARKAAGGGSSLERGCLGTNALADAAWGASLLLGGTPGQPPSTSLCEPDRPT
eukprot:SAG11_NODE_32703_length_281_cov_1.137363_1_plen_67_part_10